jgi:SAM-dependent methyltransferase
VDFGSLGRTTPISDAWGADRGEPIDRYYIGMFLADHADAIRGDVLEIGDPTYTARFGSERVGTSIVFDIDTTNPNANLHGDLSQENALPESSCDCAIVTQVLQYIDDPAVAIDNLFRALRTGGVALVTVPSLARIDPNLRDTDLWRFTPLGVRRLFERRFGNSNVTLRVYGNVLSSIAFLHGVAREELDDSELDHADADFPLIVGVRAVRTVDVA